MLTGLYSAAAGMIAQLDRHDVIANNLANISTAGFKRTSVGTHAFEVGLRYADQQGTQPYCKAVIPSTVLSRDQRPGPLIDGQEGSNVNAVEEMVNIISALRAYESCQRAIQSLDQVLDKAINVMNRTG